MKKKLFIVLSIVVFSLVGCAGRGMCDLCKEKFVKVSEHTNSWGKRITVCEDCYEVLEPAGTFVD